MYYTRIPAQIGVATWSGQHYYKHGNGASQTRSGSDTHCTSTYSFQHTFLTYLSIHCLYIWVETDRNSVSVTVFRPKPPKNMVSAWLRLRQKGTAELRFRPKLDHVETETSRNWIGSVSCSDLQSDDVIFQKQWAYLLTYLLT